MIGEKAIEFGNGTRAVCPLSGSWCRSACMWLQFDDDGNCTCSIAMLAVSDVFSADLAHERPFAGAKGRSDAR